MCKVNACLLSFLYDLIANLDATYDSNSRSNADDSKKTFNFAEVKPTAILIPGFASLLVRVHLNQKISGASKSTA